MTEFAWFLIVVVKMAGEPSYEARHPMPDADACFTALSAVRHEIKAPVLSDARRAATGVFTAYCAPQP